MILHTLNKPPRAPAAIACLEVLASSSEDRNSLLLLEDGVYMADNSNKELVRQVSTRIYALDSKKYRPQSTYWLSYANKLLD